MTDTQDNDVKDWMERIQRRRLTASEYLKLLENFVKKGEQPEIETDVLTDYAWQRYDDPILRYIVEVTHDPMVQARVLTSRMAGKVFYETMGRFVVDCLHEQKFCTQAPGRRIQQGVPEEAVPAAGLAQRGELGEATAGVGCSPGAADATRGW